MHKYMHADVIKPYKQCIRYIVKWVAIGLGTSHLKVQFIKIFIISYCIMLR